jgi:hypothetical protein
MSLMPLDDDLYERAVSALQRSAERDGSNFEQRHELQVASTAMSSCSRTRNASWRGIDTTPNETA